MTRPAAPARPRQIDAVLRIVTDPPSAHYQCHRCPYNESARGRDRTREFTQNVRTAHRTLCPANQKGTHQ